uniref:Uncharacterized protein n=1 Tax=Peronospora matthiolae TaxID=2874970 RepID=A0AAV1T5B7_9STRA
MPLLLRTTAPSPSIDELVFAVTAAPLSSQRSASSTTSERSLCATHDRPSVRRRRSTVGTDSEVADWLPSTSNDLGRHFAMGRCSHQSVKCDGDVAITSKDAAAEEDKRSSRDTQLEDDDHLSSGASFASEAGRISGARSCICSCADANEFGITLSSVIIEGRQLAVVDKELRDLRTTLVRKLCSRLTKISGFGRRKPSGLKPVA